MKTNWKAFNIKMPEELIPLYDFLQSELNYILSNEKEKLLSIDLTQHRGNIWRGMRDLFNDRIKQWPIHNKTWHSYILYENIRRELESKNNNIEIYNQLENNNFEINSELRSKLTELKLFPTNMQLKNMVRSKRQPMIPDAATFNLDYSISERQFFRLDNNGLCHIKVSADKWIDYQIVVPISCDHRFTGKIAKPRFIKRKSDGRYIGICSYEYEYGNQALRSNVLGVDLGQVKLFSSVVLFSDGTHSDEIINSKRLSSQQEKINNLRIEKSILYNKISSYEKMGIKNQKLAHWKKLYKHVTNKITRIKSQQCSMVANEVIEIALGYKCKEIHLENLSWLESTGGKWNFSEMQMKIEEKARSFGIQIVKVNAANTSQNHPITNEPGKLSGRKVVFASGEELDRDFMAAINIASRHKKKDRTKTVKCINPVRTKRIKTSSQKQKIKDLVNKIKGNNEIVLFLPNVAKTGNPELVVWPLEEVSSKESSLLLKYRKLHL